MVLRTAHDEGLPVRVGGPPPSRGPTEIELISALYADADVRQALARHGLPTVPPGGPIWQRFPVPARLSLDLAEELYVSCGIGVHHIELLTGQPADSVRRLLHAAGVALRAAGGRSPFMRRWRTSREGLSGRPYDRIHLRSIEQLQTALSRFTSSAAASLHALPVSSAGLAAGAGDCNFNGVTPETEETPVTDVTTGQSQEPAELSAADEQVLRELTERARAGGLKLTGEGGLLGKLTKMVVEGALEGELDDHLGYGKHDPAGRDGGNSRNGHRAKTVLTEAGPVEITVPRDRDSSFEPKIVAKRQRRLTGIDEMVISLSAKGLTHGEIAAHLAEVYGADVSKQTITTITDRVMEGMAEWQSRPLDPVYAVLFIDAINVKIREGQVANRPVYLALGVTVDGERDILGLWAGEHGDGEGAKFWLRVLSEIKNRGVRDVCMVVCDGLKGLPDAVSTVWDKTIVQTCIVHLLRNSFKYASKRDWGVIAKDLKPVYTAASEAEALDRFAEFSGKWEKRYPAIIRLWENAWAEFVPFLAFDREIRTVICTTNAIESINARLRRAVNARGHFPTEQAALKCLYLAVMSLDPTGKGRKRWTNRWKAALNAFDITFDGRLSAGRN